MASNITLTTRQPTLPKADFAFCIDFERGAGPASRVFSATHEFIRACEQLDHDLVNSIDSNIETVMVLEKDLGALGRDIQKAAIETDSQHLPDYIPPKPATLVDAIRGFQEAKDRLHENDRAYIINDNDERYDMNLPVRWDADDIEALVISETQIPPAASVILSSKNQTIWVIASGNCVMEIGQS